MEIVIILVLVLLNGFFALSEIALVSVKRSRLETLASQGSQRARTVLNLLKNPEHFLSSVQVGITLIGIISGAYGGAALSGDMEAYLSQFSFLGEYAHLASLIIVIGGITYVSIVIGELVPKTLAMNNAESIALFTVPIIKYFTLIAYPFVKLLSFSTSLIINVFGIGNRDDGGLSEDELRFLLKTAGKQGVLEREETQAHQNLFMFTDQTAKTMLTHRSELEWINIEESTEEIFEYIKSRSHSKFIAAEGSIDNILGIIYIKDFLAEFKTEGFSILDIVRKPIIISLNTSAFRILNIFKSQKQYMAIVVDEYGGIEGVITLHDLFEAILGDLPEEDEENNIFKRDDGSFLINGKTAIIEINQYFGYELIEKEPSRYTTISGFVLDELKHVPVTGEKMIVGKLRIEIVDMDGLRIDKLLVYVDHVEKDN